MNWKMDETKVDPESTVDEVIVNQSNGDHKVEDIDLENGYVAYLYIDLIDRTWNATHVAFQVRSTILDEWFVIKICYENVNYWRDILKYNIYFQ